MKHPKNIADVAQNELDYLGFIFFPKSPRHVDAFPEVRLPESVKRVGVFVNATEEEVRQTAAEFGLHTLQLHGEESPEMCRNLSIDFEVFKVFSVGESFDFSELKPYEGTCAYFLFDTKGKAPGGNGKVFDWTLLNNYNGVTQFILSGGIGPEHVQDVLEAKNKFPLMAGIDLNSKFETEPGKKETNSIKEFIQQIRK